MLCSGAASGSSRAAGLATAMRAMRSASVRENCGSPRRWKRRTKRSSTTSSTRSAGSSTNVMSVSTSPTIPSPPSTSWQKPCVVAIVAASKRASARTRLRWRLLTSAGDPWASSATTSSLACGRPREVVREPLLGVHEPLADAVAQLAGRHAGERHEQDLIQRRALGDVARGERGDRERLAGAGAGLEHGDAFGQRACEAERLRGLGAAHRSVSSSCAKRSSHMRCA